MAMTLEPARGELHSLLSRIPHRGPMCFLHGVTAVVDADGKDAAIPGLREDLVSGRAMTVRCQARITEAHPCLEGGAVSPFIALEWFAQSAAVLMGARLPPQTDASFAGALLGTPKLTLDGAPSAFVVGDEVEIVVSEAMGMGELARMDASLFFKGQRVAQGAINVVGQISDPTAAPRP